MVAGVAVAVLACSTGPRYAKADESSESGAQSALIDAARDFVEGTRKAIFRLHGALRACENSRCSTRTRATLLRDLGAILYRRGLTEAASTAWAKAVALQSDIGPPTNPAYDTQDLLAAWGAQQSARGVVGAEGPPLPEAPARPRARFWIGVSGALDVVMMPAASDVCAADANLSPVNTQNYYCTNPDGSDFPSAAQNAHLIVPGGAGRVATTLQSGDVRVLLAIDDALSANFLLGLRLGYVVNGYTGKRAAQDGRALSLPVHCELRATYVVGRDPMSRVGFAPVAFVGGGVSEFDARTGASVAFDNVAGARVARVWLTDAPFFVAVGGGLRYHFSPWLQFTIAVRLNTAFGGGIVLPTFGPELTLQQGF